MRKIAFVNHKGGVGKTTSAVNIAAAMAKQGKRVLLVDADPQSNLTESMGIYEAKMSIYDSFSKGVSLPIVKVKENLDVVPCSLDFAGIELEIASRIAREKILLELLQEWEQAYDVCIIDCPPSLGLISLNALVASDEVMIPMLAEYLPFRGIDSIVGIINTVKKHFNPKLSIRGVFFTKHNGQRVLSREIERQLKDLIGETLLNTKIRTNVALAECQASGKDIFEYDPGCNGSLDYNNLCLEILN